MFGSRVTTNSRHVYAVGSSPHGPALTTRRDGTFLKKGEMTPTTFRSIGWLVIATA